MLRWGEPRGQNFELEFLARMTRGGLAGAEFGVDTQSRVMGTFHGSHSNYH